ncbi:thioredoxin family protein [Candidatus Beckwithbacteria bacterium]|nr:thioredoxin family protein [Candidatus Beckwithbacteria bacterium]
MKIIKIGAVWCPSCLVMRPRWQEIEMELPELETEYFDFDQDESKIKPYNVTEGKLPVFIFLDKNGKELTRVQGEPSKQELLKLIGQYKNK